MLHLASAATAPVLVMEGRCRVFSYVFVAMQDWGLGWP